MECPYCNSTIIRNLKVHISRPIGAKKNKCLQCNKVFITHRIEENIEQKNNNLTQIPDENDKT